MKTVKKFYRIDRRKIHFLKFILEGYDGIALVSTIDSAMGLVLLYISPGCEEEVEEILRDVAGSIQIEPAYPQETEL